MAGIAAAGAGAAITVAAVANDGSGSSSEDPPIGSSTSSTTSTTSSITTTTVPAGQAVEACFETEPRSATIVAGEVIRFDARCSTGDNLAYLWDFGDGRPKREGAFVQAVYNDPGVYTVKLTVTSGSPLRVALSFQQETVDEFSVDVTVLAPPQNFRACFQSIVLNPGFDCDMEFDASCSKGDIVGYDWVLDITNVMGAGSVNASGVIVSHNWTGFPGCVTFPPWPTIGVLLTITDKNGQKTSVQGTTEVQYLTNPFFRESTVDTSFTSFLGVAPFDGKVAGQVRHNGERVDQVRNDAPSRHDLRGRLGENTVDASLTTPMGGPGFWRFDFRGASGFVAGSIRVKSGQVIALDAHSVVLRLSGTAGEHLRFSYQLLP